MTNKNNNLISPFNKQQTYIPASSPISSRFSDNSLSQNNTSYNNVISQDNSIFSTSSNTSIFVCNYCQKKFTKNSSLKIHIRIHTSERSFIKWQTFFSISDVFEHYQYGLFPGLDDVRDKRAHARDFDRLRLGHERNRRGRGSYPKW